MNKKKEKIRVIIVQSTHTEKIQTNGNLIPRKGANLAVIFCFSIYLPQAFDMGLNIYLEPVDHII